MNVKWYEKKLNEQKEEYELKLKKVNDRVSELEKEVKEMKEIFLKLKNVFIDYK